MHTHCTDCTDSESTYRHHHFCRSLAFNAAFYAAFNAAFTSAFKASAAALLVLLALLPQIAKGADEQKPQVAPSRARPDIPSSKPVPAAPKAKPMNWDLGPPANWIWGPKAGAEAVTLRHEFQLGAVKNAVLIATCDNTMQVKLNGKQIARSTSWERAVEVDVTEKLKTGANELWVDATNEGSVAGFVLKLAVTDAAGKTSYVVTDKQWQSAEPGAKFGPVSVIGKLGVSPWGNVFAGRAGGADSLLPSLDPDVFTVLPGFQIERLYTVPKATQGSWVCMTFDNKGRILASDQGNQGIYRITPSPIGSDQPTQVEKLDINMTAAQGMLYAFDSLYFSVNGKGNGSGSGFYRARDTDGDEQFDEVKLLKKFQGGGEHGPHALRLSPDGASIYVIAGNHTNPPEGLTGSRIRQNWSEDLLLPRQWDARGHARGKLAPGGWICRTDPAGAEWEMFSIGYRNPYDMDFNADGELFAYDADMEWDMGTPWYRPTRVVHATSGSEFGWRSGTGKWPAYYADSLPPAVNIGPGSPVGATFGYGAKFPAKYQNALYILDWTFGTMYAVHLKADGASYTATKEEFVSRMGLPLTDAAVGPDGALYFTVGGRGTQSELFRVTYVGDQATSPAIAKDTKFAKLRQLRRELESLHQNPKDDALELIWDSLGHSDRHIRFAARTALEHLKPAVWQQRVAKEADPHRLIQSSIAYARQGDKSLQGDVIAALSKLDWHGMDQSVRLDALRALSLVFIRHGKPDADTAAQFARQLDPLYPAKSDDENRELSRMLVYLNSDSVIDKTLKMIANPRKQSAQEVTELLARNRGYGGSIAKMLSNLPELQNIHYAFVLRNMRYGWTLEQRKEYLGWLNNALSRSGGASYQGFINNIKKDALANASEAELAALESSVPPPKPATLPKPIGPGKTYSVDAIEKMASTQLLGRDFSKGQRAFAAARCIVCHRFDGSGGATGPDLTNVAARFRPRDLAEAIADPSKVISDQYRAHQIRTSEGKVITGRLLSDADGMIEVLVDPEDASKVVKLAKDDVETMRPSPTSLMPKDTVKPLNEQELADLLAYLLSRGNPDHVMFRK